MLCRDVAMTVGLRTPAWVAPALIPAPTMDIDLLLLVFEPSCPTNVRKDNVTRIQEGHVHEFRTLVEMVPIMGNPWEEMITIVELKFLE